MKLLSLRTLALTAAITGSLLSPLFSSVAHSADFTWGGTYRMEAIKLKNPELGAGESNKAYMLHHLILTPKIVAADGLTIYSRFDILNNKSFIGADGRVNSTAGDFMGNGPGEMPDQAGATATTGSTDSNVLGRTQRASPIQVTAVYATWAQEFGQLVVGRVPFQFGLGTAYSAGNGLFDHYVDTKDLVGYKVVLGNLSIFPMLGKVNEGNIGEEDDVNDYAVQVQYENPETELSLGLLYQIRSWTFSGNDSPGWNAAAPAGRADGGKSNLIGIFASEKAGDFHISVEADMLSGDTGIHNAAGSGVSVNSYGVAGEVMWKPESSRLSAHMHLGMASGDDPNTTDSNEGFIFSRNYDVAMLMFNHPLGQYDALRTGLGGQPNNRNQIDSEAISNALYFAPGLQFQWRENLSYGGTLIYAMLNKEPIAGGSTATDLGYELDLNVTYKPYERLTWITEVGALLPGSAWKGSAAQVFDNKFAYGVSTKAAISF
jgi:hypothetical protein